MMPGSTSARMADRQLRIICCDTLDDAAGRTASILRDYVCGSRSPRLGLATGRTMLPVYAYLRSLHAEGSLSLARCQSFNLDEYCGLPPGDPSSFASYMRRNLFDHVDMLEGGFHLPDEADPAAFDALIRQHGRIGLQLLGMGRNGHIGFNEPGAESASRTRVVPLAESTRAANAADFPAGAAVPRHAVTMGIATILDAEAIVLLATGSGKAEILRRAFRGPITADCPASYLQTHDDVTVICDSAAAALIEEPS